MRLWRLLRSNTQGERDYIESVLDVERQDSPFIRACLASLDIIDMKAAALLQFIGILAAGVFFLLSSEGGSLLFQDIGTAQFASVIPYLLLAIAIMIVLAAIMCLRCLYIIGPQNRWTTISQDDESEKARKAAIEDRILVITDSRRRHYLLAYGLTVCGTGSLILLLIATGIAKAV